MIMSYLTNFQNIGKVFVDSSLPSLSSQISEMITLDVSSDCLFFSL